MKRLDNARILMYSHDTFGLGHLRRCRTIAHALVDRFKGLTVLIISGSQIAGAFDFKARVDFVKIPSVIKLYDGDYASVSDHIDITDTLAMRERLICETAEAFRPDIFIVDKEPLGLRGEVEKVLIALQRKGCRTVLGLRDVMDSPDNLATEWAKKDMPAKMAQLYDEVWIYGPESFHDPLEGIDLPDHLRDKLRYTGFLHRATGSLAPNGQDKPEKDYILVTAGGGGDGEEIMDLVLSAREYDRNLVYPLQIVTGPFMATETREALERRANNLHGVTVEEFDNEMEATLSRAQAVVGMCGYNTFCEVLSFDKPALFMPRTHPRAEQLIRATRAADLGLSQMIDMTRAQDAAAMADALHALPNAPVPSGAEAAVDLNGLERIGERVEAMLA
ncbi:MAG: glycosyltransferase [Pseudomonadota bacterium]